MSKPKTVNPTTPSAPASETVPLRDRMEFIRFRTREDSLRAMGIFRHVGSSDIFFTFREDWPEDTCVTNTATVRALQRLGIPFEWLTEHIQPEPP